MQIRVSGYGGWFLLRLSLHDPVLPLNIEVISISRIKHLISVSVDYPAHVPLLSASLQQSEGSDCRSDSLVVIGTEARKTKTRFEFFCRHPARKMQGSWRLLFQVLLESSKHSI